jgi:hypothetical protein
MKAMNYVHLDTKSKKIDKETKFVLRREKRGVDIPLDLTSDDYRCCPQCTIGFMADNEKQIFCCQKCHDDYNNAKRKKKNKEMKAASAAAAQNEFQEITVPLKRTKHEQLVYSNKFLKRLFKEGIKEVVCEVNFLTNNGVDLDVFHCKIPLKSFLDNIPRYITRIGSFTIERITNNRVLIKNY